MSDHQIEVNSYKKSWQRGKTTLLRKGNKARGSGVVYTWQKQSWGTSSKKRAGGKICTEENLSGVHGKVRTIKRKHYY